MEYYHNIGGRETYVGKHIETKPDASTTVKGVVLQSEAQADSVATTASGVVTDFNALLAKLRTAGILAE